MNNGLVRAQTANKANTSGKKTIIENQSDFTPIQKLKGDTLFGRKSTIESPNLPGKTGDEFSADQDSNYYRAMKLRISSNARFASDLKRFERSWIADKEMSSDSPLELAARNMNIPSEMFAPSGAEITAHQYNLLASTHVPFITTYNPYSGIKVGLSTIGRFLGLIEDLSPNLTYQLEYGTEVEIVIYSMKATVIATLFKGQQQPGNYKFTWNLRDDKGMKMPSGDYVGEIRVGKERLIRKRIYIP